MRNHRAGQALLWSSLLPALSRGAGRGCRGDKNLHARQIGAADDLLRAFRVWPDVEIEDIGWDGRDFIDLQDRPIRALFKLYPWEWLIAEEFGAHLLSGVAKVIELLGMTGALKQPLPAAEQFVDLTYLQAAGLQ